jgi:hypothetical protein
VATEDVVDVLGKMVEAVRGDGLVLDLQVLPRTATVEAGGRVLGEVQSDALFARARAAAAALDALVASRLLREEARDDHDVLKHYADGAELVEDFAGQEERLPEDAVPALRALGAPCVIRHRCRLRRLRVALAETGSAAYRSLT